MSRAQHLFALAILLALSACNPSPGAATRYKISVSADGLYRITGAQLQSAGMNLDGIDPATLQLFRGDREVAIHAQGKGANLTLDFYGQASDSPYSAHTVYWLRWGAQNGKRMREVAAARANAAPQESFQDTLTLARPSLYVPQARAEAPWFWHALTAPATTTITLTLPAALPGQAHLRVQLWGNSEDPANPDHHLRAFFNDARVADETWDGQGARALAATVTAREGNNFLRLVAPGDTEAIADVVLLESLEISFTRRLIAQNDALVFRAARGAFRIAGFTGDAIDVYDLTDPAEPTRVTNMTISARAVTFSSEADAPRHYLAVGPTARQPVARIAPMQTLGARAREADYVVVTHPDFSAALEPLVKWRAQRGLKPVIVTTEEIYDEFGYGAESPWAIRAFLDSLQPKPRFVLLVGKASFDYRDYLNAPNKNLTPTFLLDTPHLNQAASDNWFAATSTTDVRPAFAIGRIPAKTPEQVARGVGKIITFESSSRTADWRHRAIFVADDKEPTFTEMVDALADKLPAQITRQKIDLGARQGDVKGTRTELIARWNAGARWLTYIGHGSLDTWAEGPLFSVANLAEIKNADRLPILFTPTCLDGFFYHPQKDSLAEELLFKNDGGIIAGVVPTGLSLPEQQRDLMLALFDELYARRAPTLGEALMRAKQRMSVASAEAREVIETFGLLGDPALEY